MSLDQHDRVDRHTTALRLLARGLLLVPLVPVLLAFTSPIASLELPDAEPVSLTLRGLVAEFAEMRDASALKPVVVVVIVGLAVLFVGCCAVALSGIEGRVPDTRRDHSWGLAVRIAAPVVVTAALALPVLLDRVDHVGNDIHGPPFGLHVQGWAFAILASTVSVALLKVQRNIDDAL
jgi:hypothetical protein